MLQNQWMDKWMRDELLRLAHPACLCRAHVWARIIRRNLCVVSTFPHEIHCRLSFTQSPLHTTFAIGKLQGKSCRWTGTWKSLHNECERFWLHAHFIWELEDRRIGERPVSPLPSVFPCTAAPRCCKRQSRQMITKYIHAHDWKKVHKENAIFAVALFSLREGRSL